MSSSTFVSCLLLVSILAGFSLGREEGVIASINDVNKLKSKVALINKAGDEEEADDETTVDIHKGRGKYSCLACSAPNCDHPKTCHNAIRCYTAHVRDTDGVEHKSKGCTKNHQHTMFHCATISYDGEAVHTKYNRSAQYAFDCCEGDMCNNHTIFPELPPVPIIQDDAEEDNLGDFNTPSNILAIVLPVLLLVVIVSVALVIMRKSHLKRMDKLSRNPPFMDGPDCEYVGLRAHAVGDSTLREYQKGLVDDEASCITSGSGSGMPRLIKRTLAKDITLDSPIGKGRYGEVWKGSWNGSDVAVKIFFSRDEESFKRETKIYSTVLLRHDNILGYYGSDCTSRNSCTQNWLVTHYHPLGSLYDYLNRPNTSLTADVAFKIIITSLTGLVHLHAEVFGSQGKPAIAHRDIKSKNILVRGETEDQISCVVADFGLAVTQEELPSLIMDVDSNTRVGTKRYMSPEVLDLSIIQKKSMEAFKRSDIYSFSLVMWEVLRRTRADDSDPNSAEEFALPYHMDVGPDPSFEEMRKVVCVAQRRPDIPRKWLQNQFIANACSLMKSCWHENPSVRLSGLRLKKSLYHHKQELDEAMGRVEIAPSRGPIYVAPPTVFASNFSSSATTPANSLNLM